MDEFLFESTGNEPSASYKQWLRTSYWALHTKRNPNQLVWKNWVSNAMMLASSLGWDTMVNDMIKRNIFNPDDLDAEGWWPLHTASRFGNLSTVQLLLEHGAFPDLKDKSGQTPLCHAVESGYKDVVELLLDTGEVDPDSKDHRGHTPLMYGCASYRGEGAASLLLRTPGVNPAYVAPDGKSALFQTWSPLVIEELLKFDGVDINSRDRSGRTLLSRAAMDGNFPLVRFFLGKAETNRNAADIDGRTPILLATAMRQHEAISLLLNDPTVELNAPDDSGRTALSYAAEAADDAIIKTLLASDRVDPDSRDHLGRSPLSWSVRKWRPSMDKQIKAAIKALLADGRVDVDSCDNAGRTPVSIAADNGCVEIVNVLMKMRRADTGRPGNDEWTLLRWAQANRHKSGSSAWVNDGRTWSL
ncbi:hypothetical protein CMUS01_15852 [Colletotrichum musicola]|uniref:Ankyrin repeat protein n=1 Tax=Colletotrichum musicola TaxID=2175873 RepID=A0A8H6ITR5_9PEZI|nr:hypothetical protein CMUS01_15852 [Colletotrichum musicola]